ncbi:HAMP domain-containing sensor histidine kinase [Paraclostridium bifermentans]|uniref:HAMP domain-containing sensor histidine kinase n=1 Tax=Paraclostridium bifermentans TaxID=1490 RepID=UPI0018AC26EA|nr:HAMP domain-containing sensor histidine kinase [Paraclostridium bifermentans]
MDWIDEKLLKLKDKIKAQSLRKAMSLYIFIAIIVVIIFYILTTVFCQGWKELVYTKYSIDIDSYIPIESMVKLEPVDKVILYGANIIKEYSIVIYSIIAIIITSNMFYKNKIKVPIEILKEEAKHISRNDLSFSCIYNSGDELGEICEAFDKMRIQLIYNNENIWNLMEGQRQLNSAFAHDIRTPLTVIQGYTDVLLKYYPQGKITEEKLLEKLTLIQSQLSRLKNLSETMKDIQDIGAMEVKPKLTEFNSLEKKINEIINGITPNNDIEINIYNRLKEDKGYFDESIILQVVDNLLSNALSFTKNKIDIILELEKEVVYIYIRDNGEGFSKKELYSASNPYYSSRSSIDGHFGIGLTICKSLCEKHGGRLSLNNSTSCGAIVCASFFTSVDKK